MNQLPLFTRPISEEITIHLQQNYISLMSLWTKDFREGTTPPVKFFQKLANTYGYEIPLRVAENIYWHKPEINSSFEAFLTGACKRESENGEESTE